MFRFELEGPLDGLSLDTSLELVDSPAANTEREDSIERLVSSSFPSRGMHLASTVKKDCVESPRQLSRSLTEETPQKSKEKPQISNASVVKNYEKWCATESVGDVVAGSNFLPMKIPSPFDEDQHTIQSLLLASLPKSFFQKKTKTTRCLPYRIIRASVCSSI